MDINTPHLKIEEVLELIAFLNRSDPTLSKEVMSLLNNQRAQIRVLLRGIFEDMERFERGEATVDFHFTINPNQGKMARSKRSEVGKLPIVK